MKRLIRAAGLLTLVSRAIRLAAGQWLLPTSGDPEPQPEPGRSTASTSEQQRGAGPPLPPVSALQMPAESLALLGSNGDAPDTEDAQRLWLFLQEETYRQRGEGFRRDWAFHLHATNQRLGAPLAPSARSAAWVRYAGQEYGFQPFARDTLFNEIPFWSAVQTLNSLVGETIPAMGLERLLLEASYRASGDQLHDDWAFHQVAVREQIGPPLGRSYRLTIDRQDYYVQVFALDTLYSTIERPGDVRRLSMAPAGPLRERLWGETYQLVGGNYAPDSPFHQFAVRETLGSPLSGIYRTEFEGNALDLQVFALDTLYARPGDTVARQSALPMPTTVAMIEALLPQLNTPADAMSATRPLFTLLPVDNEPRISQFYGYTRFAAGPGRHFYLATQGRHPGIDFAVPVGTPLLSIASGLVVWAGANISGVSFGAGPRSVIVRYGNIYALYGHISSELVQKGDFVQPGQAIARSGFPSAPHLHFELRPVPSSALGNRATDQNPINPGYAVNPITYFSPDLQPYFSQQLLALGGLRHFCRGSLDDQDLITFGAPIDNRPCL